MTTYNYTRTFAAGKWNINNPDDVDANGQAVTLAERIKAQFPGKTFKVILNDRQADIDFDIALTSPEQTDLNTVVSTHEAASGTPDLATILKLNSPDGSEFNVSISDAGAWVISAV